MSLPDDESLRDLLFSWRDEALRFIYLSYYRKLVYNVNYRIRDIDAAEDIVQQALAILWDQHKKIATQPLPVMTYLFAILKNKSVDYFHRNNRRHPNAEEFFSMLPDPTDEDYRLQLDSSRRNMVLWMILSRFPLREKQSLIMKYYMGKEPIDIATEMNVTIKAVQRSLTSGIKRLKTFKAYLT